MSEWAGVAPFSSALRHLSTSLASLIKVSHLTWIIHQAANQKLASRAVMGAFLMIPSRGFFLLIRRLEQDQHISIQRNTGKGRGEEKRRTERRGKRREVLESHRNTGKGRGEEKKRTERRGKRREVLESHRNTGKGRGEEKRRTERRGKRREVLESHRNTGKGRGEEKKRTERREVLVSHRCSNIKLQTHILHTCSLHMLPVYRAVFGVLVAFMRENSKHELWIHLSIGLFKVCFPFPHIWKKHTSNQTTYMVPICQVAQIERN